MKYLLQFESFLNEERSGYGFTIYTYDEMG